MYAAIKKIPIIVVLFASICTVHAQTAPSSKALTSFDTLCLLSTVLKTVTHGPYFSLTTFASKWPKGDAGATAKRWKEARERSHTQMAA